jgi:hypothetical protein
MRCVWGVLPNFAVWDPGVRRLGPALRIGPNVVLPSGVSILSKSSRSPCTFTGRRPETEITETLSLGSVISMAASSQAASIRIAALTQAAVGIRYPNMGLVRSLGHEADSAGQSRCGPGSRLEAAETTLVEWVMSGRTTMVGRLDGRRGLGRTQEQIALPRATFGRRWPPSRNNLAPCRNRAPLFLAD